MLATVVLALRVIPVTLETPKVVVSIKPLGTVAGVQLAAVFQSPPVLVSNSRPSWWVTARVERS